MWLGAARLDLPTIFLLGGPLAAVRDGDEISISVQARRVDVKLSDEEIQVRLRDFIPPEPRITTGVLVD